MKSFYEPMNALHSGLPRGNSAAPCLAAGFLAAPWDTLSPEALLAHFRQRGIDRYFPLKPGKPKHVESAERVLRHEFDLNNETHRLAWGFDWMANPSQDLEWLILLHKFYYSRDLALAYEYTGDERYARHWVELVTSWIQQVPEGFLGSQVTGRRLEQWLLAFHYFVPGRRCQAIGGEFLVALLHSIQSQALYLCKNLTPEGNHRTIELCSIFAVAVLFPELRASSELLAFARRELVDNLRADFLPDGVQKELSTDYHHTVLKNFLRTRELAELNRIELPTEFHERLGKAFEFSVYAHKPDGFLPAINDGDALSYAPLLRKAHRFYPVEGLLHAATGGVEGSPPEQRSRLFADSGYCVLRSDWTEHPCEDARYFFFDCGKLGFGSHGHYDLLSFEAAAFGRSLVVDPGRYTYHEDEDVNWRRYFKGTAAHNTVMVDGRDQSEYCCGAPLGPEPSGDILRFVSMAGFDYVHGRALSPQYPVVHERKVFFAGGEYWIIADLLLAEGQHRYDQFFHLSVEAQDQTRPLPECQGLGFISPQMLVIQPVAPGIEPNLDQGFVSPEYGIKHPAPVIRYTQAARGNASFQTLLYPFRSQAPNIEVRSLPVTGPAGEVPFCEAVALEVIIESGSACYRDCLLIAAGSGTNALSFGDVTCRADLLFVRRNAAGEVVSLQADGLEALRIGHRSWVEASGTRWRLSCSDGRLAWKAGDLEGEDALPSLDELPEHLRAIAGAKEAR